MVLAQDGGATWTSLLDLATPLGPALLALAGVWLGSRFTRSREDRSWRRAQLIEACRGFIRVTSAVEQWATSEQFAARLGAGQYPTDYKKDREELDAAVAALAITSPEAVSVSAAKASEDLHAYVEASRRHQASKPKGDVGHAADYQQALSTWNQRYQDVETLKDQWRQSRSVFISAARAELDVLK